MSQGKIVTFACHGTLMDSSGLRACIEQIARENGLDELRAWLTFRSYEERIRYGEGFHPYEELVRRALDWADMELRTQAFSAAFGRYLDAVRSLEPFPEAAATLDAVHELGYETAMLANTSQSVAERYQQTLGGRIDRVVTATDACCYKPSIRFFDTAERILGLDEREHVHVAAGFWSDIVPAGKYNWRKVWVNRRGVGGSERYRPYDELADLSGLPALLRG